MLAISVLFLLVGLATAASGGLLVGIAVVLLSGWFIYGSWRSGQRIAEVLMGNRA
jgi:uncharacterized membrane protein